MFRNFDTFINSLWKFFVQNSSLKDSPIVQHYPDVDQAQCGRCAVITLVTAQPRTSAQPHLGTSLGTSARDSESPPTLTTGGATWLIPCKFHDNNTRPAAPQQPVPAVVMTECGGVVIEIICRKIFCGQQINCTNTARLTSHR